MEANIERDRLEFQWVQLNEAADLELAAGQLTEVTKKLRRALEIAQQFERNDPRLASSLSNVAVSHRIRGNFKEAEQHYRKALLSWQTASGWIDDMHLSARARSSLFHLRMERKHHQHYERIGVKKYEGLLPAGRAGTYNNLAELYQITDRLAEAEQLYEKALDDRTGSMGEDEDGVAIIRRNIANLSNEGGRLDSTVRCPRNNDDEGIFSAQATRNRWIVDHPPEFTDEGRFMAALLLTQVIDHLQLAKL